MATADALTTNVTGGHGGISSSSGGGVYYCPLCNKPIASEFAFRRHTAYCRRTSGNPRKRKRSCTQCHRAKAKCSFESQCSRCISKGFRCEYEKIVYPPASSETSDDLQDGLTPEPSGRNPGDDIGLYDVGSSHYASTEFASLEGATTLSKLPINAPPPLAAELRTDPRHQASALFLIDMIRGFPHMMSRRETFPAFIHGQWHKPELPTTFANCMRISQIFLARSATMQGRELFYSALSEERTRLKYHLSTTTKEELVMRLAVHKMYALMVAFDNETLTASLVPELEAGEYDTSWISNTARECFTSDGYVPFDIDSIGDPNETWEEFVYAEARRRCALFWFVVSRVIVLTSDLHCPPILRYRGLALPSPETLWSARTNEEWEAARAELQEQHQEPLHHNILRTVGDLIDSRACTSDPRRRNQVSNWLATSDKLGLMVMIASSMI
ncbi:hypothetical protein F5Y14DRAFT_73338 [Nemania sp. NC0429]|nr:hypothetical protein F5Y14DRAFT_73338 [Nemania sp. NC0429]